MTLYDRPRLQVLVADKDLTDRCDSVVFSATDAGGYEIATLGLPSVDRPKKGAAITIRAGLEVAWTGRVTEIADHSQHGRATKTTGCEGYRALLRDTDIQMVYVDRDLTQWGPPSTARQIAIVGGSEQLGSSQAASDPTSNLPAVVQSFTDSWASPWVPLPEAWYDAGPGNLIAAIYFDTITSTAAGALAGIFAQMSLSADDIFGGITSSVNLASTAGDASFFSPGATRRYALVQTTANTAQGVQGATYQQAWRNLAVYGNHGLTFRGANPPGFYPSDIARHALSQCAGISVGNIIDAVGYIAPHVVYRTPVPADQIIDDMAKLMGWTWGVWEPSTILGSGPRLDFRPPPTDATCVVTKAECDQLDVTSRIGDLYNVCQVTYTDAAGSIGLATVTLANPQLAEAGIATRTLQLDMGLGSQAAATAFGLTALALSQIAARAAGQATLPVSVRLPGGGSKPACLIRPGIDRLRIVDLVDGGPLLDLGTSRRDVFRISRVETTVGKDGTPSTQVELDSGANLLETLQARLAIAAGVVGSGASGG